MTTYHDELKWRRRRYLRNCMLCRWGSIRHCDFALSYPHLGIAERWDLLRQRERAERWHPFRNRSGDVKLRPPLPASYSDHSLGRNARASVCAGSRRRGVAGRRHLDCVPRTSWPLIRTIARAIAHEFAVGANKTFRSGGSQSDPDCVKTRQLL